MLSVDIALRNNHYYYYYFPTCELFAKSLLLYREISHPSDAGHLQEHIRNFYEWKNASQIQFVELIAMSCTFRLHEILLITITLLVNISLCESLPTPT